jgi:hypothetical protein
MYSSGLDAGFDGVLPLCRSLLGANDIPSLLSSFLIYNVSILSIYFYIYIYVVTTLIRHYTPSHPPAFNVLTSAA